MGFFIPAAVRNKFRDKQAVLISQMKLKMPSLGCGEIITENAQKYISMECEGLRTHWQVNSPSKLKRSFKRIE